MVSSDGFSRGGMAAAVVCSALLTMPAPAAGAAPEADGQGYVESTARCDAPDEAVIFGSTETARVAICKTPDDKYEYRGVRVSDGAKLIAPASRSGGVSFLARDHGSTYTVTTHSLVVSKDGEVVRREPMLDFHEPGDTTEAPEAAPEAPEATPAPEPTGAPDSAASPETPTSLPPPLPAEVGGSG
jgi:hypothetical protein